MILGDKHNFAIEYEVTKKYVQASDRHKLLYGRSRIFIKNEQIGNWNEENLLGVFVSSLAKIEKIKDTNIEILRKSNDEQLKFLFVNRSSEENEWLNLYQVLQVENFDDFNFSIFRINSKLIFMWNLAQNPVNYYPGYSNDIFVKRIERDIVIRTIREFEESWILEYNNSDYSLE